MMKKLLYWLGEEVGRMEFYLFMFAIFSFLALAFIKLNTTLIAIENLLGK